MAQPGIEIRPPIRELRRAFNAIDRGAGRGVTTALKSAVSRVVEEAAGTAPHRSGALAASYKPYVKGNLAGVRSRLPYAPVIEFGGTIKPKGAPITFQRRLVVTRAAERQADNVVHDLGDEIEKLARVNGFR